MIKNIRNFIRRLALSLAVVVAYGSLSMAAQVGVWQFDGNLNNGQPGGAPMAVLGGWNPAYASEMIGGSPGTVLSFPAFDNSQALDMPNEAGPNGSGGLQTKNNWSIVMDVKFPVLSPFTGLWETDAIGSSDADYFIRDDSGDGSFGSIGVSGQYGGLFNANAWARVAVTVDSVVNPGTYTVNGYIDGVLAGTATTSTAPGGKEAVKSFLHLFADDDFETSAGLVNSVAYYGQVLSESAIGSLGGPSAAGVPSAASQTGLWNFNNNLNNAISGRAPLSAAGGWAPTYVNETIGGSPATVLSFPAMTNTQALDMPNEAAPDDLGVLTSTNIWSIVMDVKFPVLTSFTSLWNTDSPLDTDGEYFIRDDSGAGAFGSIGIAEQYNGTVDANKWTRIAVTVDGSVNGGEYTVTGYIDGVLAGTATVSTAPNGREAIEAILHLFTDDDGETAAGVVNSVAFYDKVLTPEAIMALGAASAAGIPVEIPPGVPGDYNNNGIVDAADYTVWRDHLGQSFTMPNDATPGMVTIEDYNSWKSHFGNSGAGSGATSVPEPTGCCLAWMALSCVFGMDRCWRARRVDPR